jgi:hypothetical protein
MSINTSHIVVAHYSENLDWLLNYNPNNIVIYSKGKEIDSKYANTIIKTENIGRESHTYLKYIIDNYDSLPEYVFFTQGNPFEHIKGDINNYIYPTTKSVSKWNVDGSRQYYFNNMRITYWANRVLKLNKYPFNEWFMKYIEPDIDPLNNDLTISYGAVFTIHRDNILSRSREYYETLMEQLLSDENGEFTTADTETGHFMERSWFYIFNLHK